VWGVTVTTNITHTYAADLDIALRSPSGTLVTLSTDNGSSSVDVFDGTVWSDAANEPVTEYTFTSSVLAAALTPESALGAFRGEDPNGTWQLEISDDANGDVGTLSGWTISLVTAAPDPIDSTETFSSANIIDFGPVNSEDTIDVAGPASICGITVTTNITHPFSADMDLFVISPAGTIVTLSTANANGLDDVFNGTVWSDAANTPVTDYVFTDLVAAPALTPEGALSSVVGEDPTGIWTLVLDDTFPGEDDGVSNGWSIDIVSCDCN
jgi:subtilisin-like proprotein convertase family protein